MVEDDNTASQTYELYGPKNYSMAEISDLVDKEIVKNRRHINIPKVLLKPVANLLNKLTWWRTMSGDEVEREFVNQEIDPKALTFKDLGIEPGDIADFTFHYLVSSSRGTLIIQRLKQFPSHVAIIPKFIILRSTAGNRAGKARREEVLTCH